MAVDRPSDTALGGAHAPRLGTRKPRASPATRRAEGAPAATAADGDGPTLLGAAVKAVAELAEVAAPGAAGNRGRLAPAGVSTLLDVEKSRTIRSAHDQSETAGANSADELCQSSLGRTKNPRRAAEAGRDGLAGDGVEVHGPASAVAVAGVAYDYCGRHRLAGFRNGVRRGARISSAPTIAVGSRRVERLFQPHRSCGVDIVAAQVHSRPRLTSEGIRRHTHSRWRRDGHEGPGVPFQQQTHSEVGI